MNNTAPIVDMTNSIGGINNQDALTMTLDKFLYYFGILAGIIGIVLVLYFMFSVLKIMRADERSVREAVKDAVGVLVLPIAVGIGVSLLLLILGIVYFWVSQIAI